jgi:hypothetical protein
MGLGVTLIGLRLLHGLIGNDTFWQYATGQWILAHHAIPYRDPFSWTVRGTPWVAQEWLWDVALAVVWHIGGLWGVTLFIWAPAWIMWPVMMATYRRAGGRTPWVLLPLTAGSAFYLAIFWPARPEGATYLMFALLLYCLVRARQGESRWAWLLVPLTWVWANFHASFLLAPIFVAIEVALASWSAQWGRVVNTAWPPSARRTLWWVLGAMLLAGAATPHGIAFYDYAWRMSTHNTMRNVITEWFSPNFHLFVYCVLFVLASGLLLWTWLTSTPLPLWWIIYTGGLIYGFLDSQRWLPYLCVALPLLVASLPMSWTPHIRLSMGKGLVLGAGLLAVVAVQWPANSVAISVRQGGEPIGAVNYYVAHAHGARIFNQYAWGDYLIYRHIPVYIDGRADLYTQTPIWNAYLAVTGLTRNPAGYFAHQQIHWVLIAPHTPLAYWLATQSSWRLVYHSSQSTLWELTRGGRPA